MDGWVDADAGGGGRRDWLQQDVKMMTTCKRDFVSFVKKSRWFKCICNFILVIKFYKREITTMQERIVFH